MKALVSEAEPGYSHRSTESRLCRRGELPNRLFGLPMPGAISAALLELPEQCDPRSSSRVRAQVGKHESDRNACPTEDEKPTSRSNTPIDPKRAKSLKRVLTRASANQLRSKYSR